METNQGNSYSIERNGSEATVTIRLSIPSATVSENSKWPWSQWQVKYQSDAVSKSVDNLAQAIGNLDHVSDTVNGRTDNRVEVRRVSKLAKLREQIAALEHDAESASE